VAPSRRSGRPDGPADLVILGPVATLAGATGHTWAEAVAIGADRVLAAGDAREISALQGPRTEVWSLPPGLAVLPGLTDAHLHLLDAALAEHRLDLRGADRDQALAAVGAAHQHLLEQGRDDAWVLGHGWSIAELAGWPDATMLEAVAPGRAVALWAHDHHSRWVSHAAMRRAGLEERADPEGGRIVRDANGRAGGLLLERAAGLVDAAIPPASDVDLEGALLAFAQKLSALGITSVHDPGRLAPETWLAGPILYRSLDARGRLPLRVTASIREGQLDAAIDLGMRTGARLGGRLGGPSGRYRDGWLKLFADGALGSRTAWLLEPYEADDPAGPPPAGPRGAVVRDRDALRAAATAAAAAGIASQIHAIGDAAVRTVLDVLAEIPHRSPVMHRVEHAQLVHPADQPRFAALGVVPSVQASHLLSDAAAARAAWGDRSAAAFPLRDLLGAGALLALGSDAPVEDPDPWPGIAAAVHRRAPGWQDEEAFHPEQAIGVAEALRAACVGGPRSLGVADEGHLGRGAKADLVVVPLAPIAGAPRERPGRDDAAALAMLRPEATLIDGRVVHRAPGFDP
jgi:predicted amidohydrolase YtcJ